MLEPYGVYQFVRSGQVAIIKSRRELLNEYLDYVNDRYRRFLASQQEPAGSTDKQ